MAEIVTREGSEIEEKNPLIPRTPTATSTVVISIASVMGALGWLGTKMLDIDEKLVELAKVVAIVESESNEHHKDRVRIEEQVIRLETQVAFIKDEQDKVRIHLENKDL